MKRESLQAYCRRTNMEYLLEQWDETKNEPETPDTISRAANRKVWWRCAKGHSWQAMVYSRTRTQSNCPVCTGKRVLAGVNDLATTNPALCTSWDAEKNAPLTPKQVSYGSQRLVWWRCEHGHNWRASVNSRSQGAGCPICTNRTLQTGCNDLRTCYPKLADEWDIEKNHKRPEHVIATTNMRAWWRCGLDHSWEASVSSRVYKQSACPYCAGTAVWAEWNDLASRRPDVAAEWDDEKNGTLRPEQVMAGSRKMVWWRCPLGHSYRSAISSRATKGTGCPYCAGRKVLPGFNDLETRAPEIAAQWHPTLNAPLTPQQVTSGSNRYAWWVCEEGHVWKSAIFSRTRKMPRGCPICAGHYPKRHRKY